MMDWVCLFGYFKINKVWMVNLFPEIYFRKFKIKFRINYKIYQNIFKDIQTMLFNKTLFWDHANNYTNK